MPEERQPAQQEVECSECNKIETFDLNMDQILYDWLIRTQRGYTASYNINPTLRGATSGAQVVCPECREESFYLCYGCDAYLHENDSHFVSNETWCEPCMDERFTRCDDCNELHDNDYGITWTYGGDRPICEACLEDYRACYECDTMVHCDDGTWDDDNDEFYCDSCWSDNATGLVGGTVRNYTYRPTFMFRWAHGKHHGFYMEDRMYRNRYRQGQYYGIELEVEPAPGKGADGSVIKEQTEYIHTNYGDFLYLKRDSSIPSGFEIVSHPASLEWWLKHGTKMFADILLRLRNAGFQSHNGGHCGLHIHTNKRPLGRLQAMKMTQFIFNEQNARKIKQLSRRNSNGLNTYASIQVPTHYNGDTCEYETKDSKWYGKYVGRMMQSRCRGALFFGQETAELRIFRGTLRDDRLWSSLEFFDLLVNYCRNGEPGSTKWNDFRQYVYQAPRQYSDLQSYFMEKEL